MWNDGSDVVAEHKGNSINVFAVIYIFILTGRFYFYTNVTGVLVKVMVYQLMWKSDFTREEKTLFISPDFCF